MLAHLRRPAAWLPLAVSLAALALVLGYAALAGTAPHADEGSPARAFQLLIAVDLTLIVWFALRWLPRTPRQTAGILALQLIAAAVPVAAVALLETLP